MVGCSLTDVCPVLHSVIFPALVAPRRAGRPIVAGLVFKAHSLYLRILYIHAVGSRYLEIEGPGVLL